MCGGRPATLDELARLAEAFRESDLPYKVDILDWQSIDDRFRQVIAAESVRLDEAAPAAGATDPGANRGATGDRYDRPVARNLLKCEAALAGRRRSDIAGRALEARRPCLGSVRRREVPEPLGTRGEMTLGAMRVPSARLALLNQPEPGLTCVVAASGYFWTCHELRASRNAYRPGAAGAFAARGGPTDAEDTRGEIP